MPVERYLVEKYAKYLRWSLGMGAGILVLLIGLIASVVMYDYWTRVRDSQNGQCEQFCYDSQAVSFAFITVTAMCLLIMVPIAAYCLHKLRIIRQRITRESTHEAAMTARGVIRNIVSI